MALTKGPLFSLEASGTIGDAVVFSRWKGRSYARRHAVPANPKSVGQVSVRQAMKFLAQEWNNLTNEKKATWEDRASAANISTFNAYCSYNLFRQRNFLGLSQIYPAALVETPPGIPTLILTSGVRSIDIQITPIAPCTTWGYRIHRSPTMTFTPVWNNCIGFIHSDSLEVIHYVDTPLAPATYYYQIVGFMMDAVVGDYSVEGSATAS